MWCVDNAYRTIDIRGWKLILVGCTMKNSYSNKFYYELALDASFAHNFVHLSMNIQTRKLKQDQLHAFSVCGSQYALNYIIYVFFSIFSHPF